MVADPQDPATIYYLGDPDDPHRGKFRTLDECVQVYLEDRNGKGLVGYTMDVTHQEADQWRVQFLHIFSEPVFFYANGTDVQEAMESFRASVFADLWKDEKFFIDRGEKMPPRLLSTADMRNFYAAAHNGDRISDDDIVEGLWGADLELETKALLKMVDTISAYPQQSWLTEQTAWLLKKQIHQRA